MYIDCLLIMTLPSKPIVCWPVKSRLLKEWERRGLIELGRGRITVQDRNALSEIAGVR